MIKQTMSEYEFTDGLLTDSYANWSREAVHALYDYYESLSDDLGEEIEFDRVAIRCDWSEYDTTTEAFKNYNYGEEDLPSQEVMLEWLEERTQVIELDNDHILLVDF